MLSRKRPLENFMTPSGTTAPIEWIKRRQKNQVWKLSSYQRWKWCYTNLLIKSTTFHNSLLEKCDIQLTNDHWPSVKEWLQELCQFRFVSWMQFYKYRIFYCCGDRFSWIMCWWMRLNWETKQKTQKMGTHKKVGSAGSATILGVRQRKSGGQGLGEDGGWGGG